MAETETAPAGQRGPPSRALFELSRRMAAEHVADGDHAAAARLLVPVAGRQWHAPSLFTIDGLCHLFTVDGLCDNVCLGHLMVTEEGCNYPCPGSYRREGWAAPLADALHALRAAATASGDTRTSLLAVLELSTLPASGSIAQRAALAGPVLTALSAPPALGAAGPLRGDALAADAASEKEAARGLHWTVDSLTSASSGWLSVLGLAAAFSDTKLMGSDKGAAHVVLAVALWSCAPVALPLAAVQASIVDAVGERMLTLAHVGVDCRLPENSAGLGHTGASGRRPEGLVEKRGNLDLPSGCWVRYAVRSAAPIRARRVPS